MNWFDGIDTPLDDEDVAELDRLEALRLTDADVSPFPGYDTYSRLRARRDRPAALQAYRNTNEEAMFGPLVFTVRGRDGQLYRQPEGQPDGWLAPRNLPARKRAYDHQLALWKSTNPTGYQAHVQAHLDQEQAKENARLAQPADLDRFGGDPGRAAVFGGLAARLFAEYRQYVEEGIAPVATALQTPPPADNPAPDAATTDDDLALVLANKCPVALCDKAAKKIKLSRTQSPTTFADARVHALAAALKDAHCLRQTDVGTLARVRTELAHRYGHSDHNTKYNPQHGKSTAHNKRNQRWDGFYDAARAVLDQP